MAELVRRATVMIFAGDEPADLGYRGSGFLVAKNRVLTCAHCVHDDEDRLWVEWHGGPPRRAAVLAVDPAERVASVDAQSVPFPDAAVLSVDGLWPHPTVPASTAEPSPKDGMYLYGITDVRTGIPEPDAALTVFESRVGFPGREFYKLGLGGVEEGMSGGPVLSQQSSAVVAMIKSTRGLDTNLGGHAVPIADALAVLKGEDLLQANRDQHNDSLDALRARQRALEDLPETVGFLLTKQAARLVETKLGILCGVNRPGAGVGDDDLPEWVARQLFELSVGDLVAVLLAVARPLGATALEIAELVAGCLPVRKEDADSWWLPTEAVLAARAEFRKPKPRVVRVGSEKATSHSLLFRRALSLPAPLLKSTPFGAQVDNAGTQVDVIEEIKESLAQKYAFDVTAWEQWKAHTITEVRKTYDLARLDPNVLNDDGILKSLLAMFGGMRFVVCSRREVPAGAESVLLDLKPPINESEEGFAVGSLEHIEEAVGRKIAAA